MVRIQSTSAAAGAAAAGAAAGLTAAAGRTRVGSAAEVLRSPKRGRPSDAHAQQPGTHGGGVGAAAAAAAVPAASGAAGHQAAAGAQVRSTAAGVAALRREFERRRSSAALEGKLRKHQQKMGNSMLKSHCRKEGLAWTLRDVAAYGLALGKMAPGAPLDWTAAVRFLAQLQPEGGGGGGGAPSPALVERVSGLMRGAAAKYDMEAFIARQQTRSKPRQQPAHGGGNEGGAGGAPAAVAGAAVAGAAVAGAPASPRPHGRNQVLAGPAAAATAAATAAAAPSPAAGGTPRRRGSGGVAPGAAASGRGNGPSAAVPVGLTSAAQSAPAPAPSAPPAVPQGPLRVGAGLEARLRAHLARQGLTQLRLRNAREGLAWSLLELVAADRDVRLSQPVGVREAHAKYQLGG
eukprot:XP_001694292.1 predicted protein [Chlamydomonas reinhardtii]